MEVTLDKDSVSLSDPVYTGNGSGRTGAAAVSLVFTLSDGSTATQTEEFTGINATITRTVEYEIGCYNVTVAITVTTEGSNNKMDITGTSAVITASVLLDGEDTGDE